MRHQEERSDLTGHHKPSRRRRTSGVVDRVGANQNRGRRGRCGKAPKAVAVTETHGGSPPLSPPASQPAQSAPFNVESVRATLATIEAGLQPWHAHGCLDPDTSEELEVPREVRSLATLVAMYGIGIVVRCAWTVDKSQLCYVHAASLRPAEVSRDWTPTRWASSRHLAPRGSLWHLCDIIVPIGASSQAFPYFLWATLRSPAVSRLMACVATCRKTWRRSCETPYLPH